MDDHNTSAPSSSRSWLMLAFKSLLGVVVLAVAIFFVGPRNEFGSDTPTARAMPTQQLNELDAWIADSESKFSEIKPGTAKGIVWANPEQQ
ncbi:MAG: hypothetical protein HQ455_10195, partial [Burkholderiales bacterium]|nr:hypothetical protein [Burkholderiales bacterium]